MHWREQELLEALKYQKLTTTNVVSRVHMCKVTALKYLEGLKTKGMVDYKVIGSSKVWFLQKKTQDVEKRIRVLVVDDDENILTIIRETFEPGQFDVLEAANGKEALGMVFSGTPDILILDIMMPNMDGYQVCRELRNKEQTRDLPIIILSARASIKDKLMAMDLDINDYIVKPFDPRELKARIKMILNRTVSAKVNT
jgi:two-component system alkaline phosphatase synthesis response regulator PhoP